MSERYPSDDALLAMTLDEQSGVEQIETGKAPYFLEFRKLVRHLLGLARRRVYQDDPDFEAQVVWMYDCAELLNQTILLKLLDSSKDCGVWFIEFLA